MAKGIIQQIRDDDVSKDDYELALEAEIEDDSAIEDASTRKFEIDSYGADYTVDILVKRMRNGVFKVPDFQRRFVWTLRHASKFIESLLMGLPVPGIFLYKEANSSQHLVIDGQQRLRTIQAFYDGKFREQIFRLEGVRAPWGNKTYAELSKEDSNKLDDSVVHATIFKQDKPKDVMDSIYYVFERINTGGIRLSPQEIRNCVNSGPFIDMVRDANTNPQWRKIFGPVNNRAKDEELILRFLALYTDIKKYQRPMNTFLNDFCESMKSSPRKIKSLRKLFDSTIALVDQAIGEKPFRLARTLNAAVFDAVMVGLAHRVQAGSPTSARAIRTAYNKLLQDEEFRSACERSTADEENVRTRIGLAMVAFEKA